MRRLNKDNISREKNTFELFEKFLFCFKIEAISAVLQTSAIHIFRQRADCNKQPDAAFCSMFTHMTVKQRRFAAKLAHIAALHRIL